MNDVCYFAYGSNLNIFQMIRRVGEWTSSKRAYLEKYKLVFNVKSSRWGGCTANIHRTGNDQDKVHGVVYFLKAEKITVMTSYEGKSSGPTYMNVKLEDDTMIENVAVYKWDKDEVSEIPPKAYQNTIVEGLIQHGYSKDIIEKVKRTFSPAALK